MNKILAIDASTEQCSVALLCDGSKTQASSDEPRHHAQNLLPMVHRLLDAQGLVLSDLDAIALTIGPGSFTGIRIAFSVVQGLAFGANLPVIPVHSMAVLAIQAKRHAALSEGNWVFPALDARMGEVYWAAYHVNHAGLLEEKTPPAVSPPCEVHEWVEGNTLQGAVSLSMGHGWQVEGMPVSLMAQHVEALPNALGILQWLEEMPAALRPQSILTLEPLYLRNEVTWKKRQRIRTEPL